MRKPAKTFMDLVVNFLRHIEVPCLILTPDYLSSDE